ncbi:uncharacterized protein LOC131836459 [Mustela lutreola]|uniref:uncharacterized protein LOC131836459 n=1 Tax=Mustela lutreola TaxID=9666 RepID=UPI0027973F52|nr:uncharacterized protein LOC131836459 [Mustela lutreola]XP_059037872.1 uncharacterized protein LOC131836459 [Mustela lutreola]XP_059037873.1 uncharacterized protein LOC131836459 [Mustela lutreola]XP_059037874.1 uncharacterized protein LOC131836459 [Mustela lutreola]
MEAPAALRSCQRQPRSKRTTGDGLENLGVTVLSHEQSKRVREEALLAPLSLDVSTPPERQGRRQTDRQTDGGWERQAVTIPGGRAGDGPSSRGTVVLKEAAVLPAPWEDPSACQPRRRAGGRPSRATCWCGAGVARGGGRGGDQCRGRGTGRRRAETAAARTRSAAGHVAAHGPRKARGAAGAAAHPQPRRRGSRRASGLGLGGRGRRGSRWLPRRRKSDGRVLRAGVEPAT